MDFWTEETLARLKALVGDGLSSGQVAARLSAEFGPISRNAVIGKVIRNKGRGFPQFDQRLAPAGRSTKRSEKDAAARQKVRKPPRPDKLPGRLAAHMLAERESSPFDPEIDRLCAARSPAHRPKPVVLDPAAYDAASRHVKLTDLERGDCRFPVTDDPGGQHLFCGLPAESGSYCAHHRVRCGGGGTLSERHALDGLLRSSSRRAA